MTLERKVTWLFASNAVINWTSSIRTGSAMGASVNGGRSRRRS